MTRKTAMRWLAAVLALTTACGGSILAGEAPVSGQDVSLAIERAVAYLKGSQADDGSWVFTAKHVPGPTTPGATALAVFALVTAGVPAQDASVRAGVAYIARAPFANTYSTALTAMALSVVDPVANQDKVAQARDWLRFNQQKDGSWGYGKGAGQQGDNSNTQFAVLGLRAAQGAGFPSPPQTWDAIEHYFRSTQCEDGGWGYRKGPSYGSMTAAGLGSLVICGAQAQREINRCGQHAHDADVAQALKWFDRHFTVKTNPGKRTWHHYYLYAVERVGVLSARRYLGKHDWYREGAEYLVRSQRPEGAWGADVPSTCFGLLFLAKGKAPVLVHKLRRQKDWNNDPNDIRNLCTFFGQAVGQKVSWQIVDLGAPLQHILAAPVLYLNGHEAVEFSDQEIEKLRQFVTQGGFIFAEACCGRKEFDQSFRAAIQRVFPDRELVALSQEHPIWRSFFQLDSQERSPLLGLRASCRTSVVYSPVDLSCKWEKQLLAHSAFRVGVNVLAYATGLEPLRDKLDKVEVIPPTPTKPLPRGAFILAQVKHAGDWEPDTRSAAGLLQFMRHNIDLDVGSDSVPVALASPDLFDCPVLYMVGHAALGLAPEEKARLKLYLERGGFLFGESCCGDPRFDASFRRLMAELLPRHPLERLTLEHPLFSTGFRINAVQYKKAVLADTPNMAEPWLEAVAIDGRLCVVYTKFSLGCAWENHPCHGCKGIERSDALKLGTNVILYGLTH